MGLYTEHFSTEKRVRPTCSYSFLHISPFHTALPMSNLALVTPLLSTLTKQPHIQGFHKYANIFWFSEPTFTKCYLVR